MSLLSGFISVIAPVQITMDQCVKQVHESFSVCVRACVCVCVTVCVFFIITVRNSSGGKVMFSQACVTGGGGMHGRGHACVTGACMAGGMHDRGHVWWGGACMAVGVHGKRDGCRMMKESYTWLEVNVGFILKTIQMAHIQACGHEVN